MIAKTLQDGRGRDWFWLENRLVDDGWLDRMGVYAWAVYTILIRLSDDRGRTFPSTTELEQLSGVSRTMVKASLRRLIQLHLMGRTRKGGPSRGSSIYRLSALPGSSSVAPVEPARKKRAVIKMEPSIDFELDLFERAWACYPKRPGNNKQQALEQWKKRRAEGHTGGDMLTGTGAYAAMIEATGIQPQYVKMACTFFGPALHFLSDYAVAAGSANGGRPTPADEVAAWNENEEVV